MPRILLLGTPPRVLVPQVPNAMISVQNTVTQSSLLMCLLASPSDTLQVFLSLPLFPQGAIPHQINAYDTVSNVLSCFLWV